MSILVNLKLQWGDSASAWGSPPTAPPSLDPLNYGFNRYAFDSSKRSKQDYAHMRAP